MQTRSGLFSELKADVPASIAVFLVALPLCLGIALASGAPMFAGIVAGVVGGVIIGALSGSSLSVSGPAAGLTAIVLAAITSLGSFQLFLAAVVLAGALQVVFGVCRAGALGKLFPSPVIRGMLAAIGLILIMKQLPHLVGYDAAALTDEDPSSDMLPGIAASLRAVLPGALGIGLVSLLVLLAFDRPALQRKKALKLVPGSLIVVVLGALMNLAFTLVAPDLAIGASHLVSIQGEKGQSLLDQLVFPTLDAFRNPQVYVTAVTLALVASIETLLSIDAADKLDPQKRKTPLNRELVAQGVGNMVSGALGGLPITAVIVRSSANVNAGARTKMSAIMHGLLLLFAVLLVPGLLQRIPLASLSAVLLVVGYKLTKPALYKEMFLAGVPTFVPFIVTVGVILATNLLAGIMAGIVVSLAITYIPGLTFGAPLPRRSSEDAH